MFAIGFLELFVTAILIFLAGVFIVWMFNSRAFRDFFGAGRAQVGKWGTVARNADPQAIIHQEIRDAQEDLSRSVSDLEESKALVAELEEQCKTDIREVNKLDAQVKASLTDDPTDASGRAAQYVMNLETSQNNSKRNNEQLTKAKTIYANNLEKFRYAQTKIRQAQDRARNLGVEIKSSETNARLAKLAQKYNVDVSGLDNRLSEAESEARRQIAKNNAVSEVQADLGLDGLAEAREEERLKNAEAKNKLDEYRKKMGIAV